MAEILSEVAQLAVARNTIRNAILNCRQCDRHDIDECPVSFHGPAPARLMIIGDAPTEVDEERGRTFTGAGASWLRMALGRVGIDIDLCFLTNAVACHGEGPPTPSQLRACGRHMGDQVRLSRPELVLTLGVNAFAATGVMKTSLASFHGHVFAPPLGPFKDTSVLATFHPSAGLRTGAEKVQSMIESDLREAARVMAGAAPLLRASFGRGGKLVRVG